LLETTDKPLKIEVYNPLIEDMDGDNITSNYTFNSGQIIDSENPPIPPANVNFLYNSETLEVGDIIEIPLQIENNPSFLTMNLGLSWDETELEFIECEDLQLFEGFITSTTPKFGKYRIGYVVLEGDNIGKAQTGNGEFCILRFKYLGENGSDVIISFANNIVEDINGKNITDNFIFTDCNITNPVETSPTTEETQPTTSETTSIMACS
jgi:hypothetical protein